MAFDVEGARKAGYSDAEIADHLAQTSKFDLSGAKKAGYTDAEIVQHLASAPAPGASTASKVMQQVGNLGAGLLRGAGSIGATILAPVDMAKDALDGKGLSLESNRARRKDMDDALRSLGADTDSLAYQGAKLGAEVAGTLGVGGGIANVAARIPGVVAAAPNLLNAIRTAGMSAGNGGAMANALTRAAGGAITGGASAGLVDPEQAGMGALVGGAAPLVMKAAGKAGQTLGKAINGDGVSPEVGALADRAKQLGIDIPADRLVNSKPLDAVASGLNYVPFSGRAGTEAKMNSQLNQAASRLMGQNTPNITKAVRDASVDLGAKFDTVLQANTVKMTPAFRQALADAENQATAELGAEGASIIHKQIADIQAKGALGEIDGEAAYNIKKTLDRIGNRNSNEAFYARDLKGALMSALNDSLGPQEAAAFAKTRQQYGNMIELEKLAKNGAEGDISVARLANLKNIRNADLQELADIAAQFVRPREGQHGAMQRALVGTGAAMTGGVPGLVAGATAGRAANMALNSNAMRALVRGQTPNALAALANPEVAQLGYRVAPVAPNAANSR